MQIATLQKFRYQRRPVVVKPYTDEFINDNTRIRTFSCDLDERELVWHQDTRARAIKVIRGNHWQLQMDNQLPQELLPNRVYHIAKEHFHRLLKGTGDLVIEIVEFD